MSVDDPVVLATNVVLNGGKDRWAVLTQSRSLSLFKSSSSRTPLLSLRVAELGASRLNVRTDEFVVDVVDATDHAVRASLGLANVDVAANWLAKLQASEHRPLTAHHANAAVIGRFYAAFKARDWQTMSATYDDAATFGDPVFANLDATQVRAMWKMFCTKSPDLDVVYSHVTANDRFATAHWDATYTFGKTGRKVLNRIDAQFELRDGKIVAHQDHFSFHAWSAQALGGVGKLAGWSSALNNAVSSSAFGALQAFMVADAAASAAPAAAAAAPAALPALPQEAAAASPSSSHVCVYSEHYAASADQVWSLAGKWLDIAWVGIVKSVEGDDASKQSPPRVGAVRTLAFINTPDGWQFRDELLEFDAAARSMAFRSISSPLPLANHRAVIVVREDDDDDDDDDNSGVSAGCTFSFIATFSIADNAAEGSAAAVVNAMRRLQERAGAGLRKALAASTKKECRRMHG
jgi:hypothetical protein